MYVSTGMVMDLKQNVVRLVHNTCQKEMLAPIYLCVLETSASLVYTNISFNRQGFIFEQSPVC